MISSCDFIKIDVEGMEPDVLMGGLNTIAMLRPYIYMEIDRKENTELILEIMAELKYQVEEHNPPLYSPEYSGKNIFGKLASLNAICTPGEKYAGLNKGKNTHRV